MTVVVVDEGATDVVVVLASGAVVVVEDDAEADVVVVDDAGLVVVVEEMVEDVVVELPAPLEVVVVEGLVAAHVGIVIALSSSVTAPLRARTRPLTLAPVSKVMDVRAMIDPSK